MFVDEKGKEIYHINNNDVCYTGFEYFENVIKNGNSAIFPTVIYDTAFLKDKMLLLDPKAGPCCDFYFLSEICANGGRFKILSNKLIIRSVHDDQDSSRSEFWMNIKVFNHFCSNEKYSDSIKKLQKHVVDGYIKNIRHLCANFYEKKVSKEIYNGVLKEIPLNFFKTGFSKSKLSFWLFNAKHNKHLTCLLCHIIRSAIRKRRKKNER